MNRSGFTLIELMLVVALLGVLASIAIPKATNLIGRAQDARTKGNLGTIRSALAIYYVDMSGWYPAFPEPDLAKSLVPKYLSAIPVATPGRGGHSASNDVLMVWNLLGENDGAGWAYDWNIYDPIVQPNPNPRGEYWGHIRVRCFHKNTSGHLWRNL